MSEEIIWTDRPSQLTNLLYFIVFAITIVLPIYRYLQTRFTIYSLSENRIFLREGVLSQKIDETELYRVRDYIIYKPFLLRIFGLGNLEVVTSDKTHSKIIFYGIKNPENLKNLLRDKVEVARKKTGTKEVDFT
jgi:uncharacterized membrane protein YdbT with pleckstrin-like domain